MRGSIMRILGIFYRRCLSYFLSFFALLFDVFSGENSPFWHINPSGFCRIEEVSELLLYPKNNISFKSNLLVPLNEEDI